MALHICETSLVARNIEIKARVFDFLDAIRKADQIADQGPAEIAQDDTFFNCDGGRLKLRQFSEGKGELIFYRRVNQAGPKESFFIRSQTIEPETLREALTLAYGQAGRVIKKRTLYLVGRTRIHLDRVEGLGEFLELEVVLSEGDSLDDGVAEAERIMRELGIQQSQLVQTAYVDLLNEKSS